jgi:EmrB/QacA subfamily drug resistance transporter
MKVVTETGAASHAVMAPSDLRLASARGRWILLATVLGSGLAGIDATVVNIALPDIGRDLDVGLSALQWTITGYTLTLAALMLLGGSLGDRWGRRRAFVIGVGWFAGASMLCAIAPSVTWLIAARALQGVGGALLTPASLAILESTFRDRDRGRAIGAWSGLSGTASAIAPFVGGWLLSAGGWRWVFLINPPVAVVVIAVALRHVPETRASDVRGRIDVAGAVLGVVALGGLSAGLIAASDRSTADPRVWVPFVGGVVAMVWFVVTERRQSDPIVPMAMFRIRQFSATNAVTFLLYAANSGALLLLVIEQQTVSGASPLKAGAALLPITVIMLCFAAPFGALAVRTGARLSLTVGPLISATGLAMMTTLSAGSGYVWSVLPAVAVFGLGLAVFVAPLTASVLGAVHAEHAGVASGVNNAVARAAGLIAVAALPAIVGLNGHAYNDPHRFLPAFRDAMWICCALQVCGALLAAVTVQGRDRRVRASCGVSLAGQPVAAAAVPDDVARPGQDQF